MLVIRSLIGRGLFLVNRSSENFYQRILGNYCLLTQDFPPEALIFLAAAPIEAFELPFIQQNGPADRFRWGGGDRTVIYRNVSIGQKIHLDILNQFLNRVLLYRTGHFTWQDRVYLSVMLCKLGIRNTREFLTALKQAAGHETGKSETKADRERYFLEETVFRRLQTAAVYRDVYRSRTVGYEINADPVSGELSLLEYRKMSEYIRAAAEEKAGQNPEQKSAVAVWQAEEERSASNGIAGELLLYLAEKAGAYAARKGIAEPVWLNWQSGVCQSGRERLEQYLSGQEALHLIRKSEAEKNRLEPEYGKPVDEDVKLQYGQLFHDYVETDAIKKDKEQKENPAAVFQTADKRYRQSEHRETGREHPGIEQKNSVMPYPEPIYNTAGQEHMKPWYTSDGKKYPGTDDKTVGKEQREPYRERNGRESQQPQSEDTGKKSLQPYREAADQEHLQLYREAAGQEYLQLCQEVTDQEPQQFYPKPAGKERLQLYQEVAGPERLQLYQEVAGPERLQLYQEAADNVSPQPYREAADQEPQQLHPEAAEKWYPQPQAEAAPKWYPEAADEGYPQPYPEAFDKKHHQLYQGTVEKEHLRLYQETVEKEHRKFHQETVHQESLPPYPKTSEKESLRFHREAVDKESPRIPPESAEKGFWQVYPKAADKERLKLDRESIDNGYLESAAEDADQKDLPSDKVRPDDTNGKTDREGQESTVRDSLKAGQMTDVGEYTKWFRSADLIYFQENRELTEGGNEPGSRMWSRGSATESFIEESKKILRYLYYEIRRRRHEKKGRVSPSFSSPVFKQEGNGIIRPAILQYPEKKAERKSGRGQASLLKWLTLQNRVCSITQTKLFYDSAAEEKGESLLEDVTRQHSRVLDAGVRIQKRKMNPMGTGVGIHELVSDKGKSVKPEERLWKPDSFHDFSGLLMTVPAEVLKDKSRRNTLDYSKTPVSAAEINLSEGIIPQLGRKPHAEERRTVEWRQNGPHAEAFHTLEWRRNGPHAEAFRTLEWGRNGPYTAVFRTLEWGQKELHAEERRTLEWGQKRLQTERRQTLEWGQKEPHAEELQTLKWGQKEPHAEEFQTLKWGQKELHAEELQTLEWGQKGPHAEEFQALKWGQKELHAEKLQTLEWGQKEPHAEELQTLKWGQKEPHAEELQTLKWGQKELHAKERQILEWGRKEPYAEERRTLEWRQKEPQTEERQTLEWKQKEPQTEEHQTLEWRQKEPQTEERRTIEWEREEPQVKELPARELPMREREVRRMVQESVKEQVELLTDQVYRRLERRLLSEKKRRGL